MVHDYSTIPPITKILSYYTVPTPEHRLPPTPSERRVLRVTASLPALAGEEVRTRRVHRCVRERREDPRSARRGPALPLLRQRCEPLRGRGGGGPRHGRGRSFAYTYVQHGAGLLRPGSGPRGQQSGGYVPGTPLRSCLGPSTR